MKHQAVKTRAIALAICIIAALSLLPGLTAMAAAYITTSVVTVNSAPVAEKLEVETYRALPVTADFRSIDPEGDTVTYSITKDGKKGSVTIDGSTFTYTPDEGEKGRDYFCYVAIDSMGNISNEATVTVRIVKQKTSVSYSDLEGSPVQYAATYLAEKGIFTGQKVGDKWLFDPDAAVTRGEFLVMCMELCSLPAIEDVAVTGFYDDGDIPQWQKPYVTAAVVDDLVHGSRSAGGQIVFSADAPITFSQAAVILNGTLDITNVSLSDPYEAVPAWACQAAANLDSCRIMSTEYMADGNGAVTRADAARMLLAASKVLEERDGSPTLLSWAK